MAISAVNEIGRPISNYCLDSCIHFTPLQKLWISLLPQQGRVGSLRPSVGEFKTVYKVKETIGLPFQEIVKDIERKGIYGNL